MPIYMGIFEKPNVLDRNFSGEVKARGFEGWIEIQSAQVGHIAKWQAPPAAAPTERVGVGHPGDRDHQASRLGLARSSSGHLSTGGESSS